MNTTNKLHKITQWSLNALKDKIVQANKAYRIGRPIISDQQFDDYCDLYEFNVSPEEWKEFRNSLHEETGKVKHPFVMGSLDKLKIEEPEKIDEWIEKYNVRIVSVSAKVDGISCRIHYNGAGEFESATTRGDGWNGQDITDKVKFVKGVPHQVDYSEAFDKPFDVRGELVITNEDFEPLAATLKNPRNAAAGIMGQKVADQELLKHVTFIAYEIMGGEIEKAEQLECLKDMGFIVVPHAELDVQKLIGRHNDVIHQYFEQAIKKDYGFPTDGIVISDIHYKAEDAYRPKAQKAVKLNSLVANTKVVNIEWSGPSKNGKFIPLAIIEPTELGGSCITKCSLHNLDYLIKSKVNVGSIVEICKRGDVIPQINKVIG